MNTHINKKQNETTTQFDTEQSQVIKTTYNRKKAKTGREEPQQGKNGKSDEEVGNDLKEKNNIPQCKLRI